MIAYSITLWAPGTTEAVVGDDGYETNYSGSYHVACPDGDPRIGDLAAAGCGRFGDEDGPRRGFFFADELDEMMARAERETKCAAEAREL